MRPFLLALALIPLPALADPPQAMPGTPQAMLGTPLTASEFDTYATGKTLLYAEGGAAWGQEQYLPDRRVLWAFTGQPCEYGIWYPDKGAICFVYEGKPDPNCWQFYHGTQGLVAQFLSGDGSGLLSEVGQTTAPMNCPGPQVGV